MVSDTIGDFIVQLTNAGAVRKDRVVLPYSKLRHAIAAKLAEKGYIGEVEVLGKDVKKKLSVTLVYDERGTHRISGVKRVSKPGRRLYTKVATIHPVKFGKGNMILSTPAGILTDDEARAQHVGGEQLFVIW